MDGFERDWSRNFLAVWWCPFPGFVRVPHRWETPGGRFTNVYDDILVLDCLTLWLVVREGIASGHGILTLTFLPVLSVTENLASEGVSGTIPGGRPGKVNLVVLSGLKRSTAGGYFSLMMPSSSGADSSSLSSSIISWISPCVPFAMSASVATFRSTMELINY